MTDQATNALRAERDRLLDEATNLRRTIDDLKAFESDYRSRLISYYEGALERLKEGRTDG